MASETDKIPSRAYLLAEVRGDRLAWIDNFTFRSWETRLNAWTDNLPGAWAARLPVTKIADSAALVTIQAPAWSPSGAMTVGEARRMLSDLVGGVDVPTLRVTGTLPASAGDIAGAAKAADARGPLAILGNLGENVAAWIVVGLVVAVVLSRSDKR